MIVRHIEIDQGKRKQLLDLCKTLGFPTHQAYIFIIEAFKLIGFRCNLEKHGDTYADWDATGCSDVQQVLAGITLI